jgi:hypothetical protein
VRAAPRQLRGPSRPRVRPGVLGTAVAGVVAGHLLTYLLAFAGDRLRHAVLTETGHRHWEALVPLAALVGVASAIGVVARNARSEAGGHPGEGRFLPLALRLAAAQLSLFVALEVLERLVAGAPLSSLFGHGLLWLGLGVQAAVAVAAALVLRVLAGVAAAVARALREAVPRARSPVPVPVAGRPVVRSVLMGGAWGLRGPPAAR